MYKVFLVDDEQLVLSGIKYMLDWELMDCRIVGTAGNGQEALQGIRRFCPDIVICDINMPVYTGTELLEMVAESNPDIAFIMLTNYQQFELLQCSLRNGAADYLLKTGLSEEQLRHSVTKAKRICDDRKRLHHIEYIERYLMENEQDALESNIRLLVAQAPIKPMPEIRDLCEKKGAFHRFLLADIRIGMQEIPSYAEFSEEDRQRAMNSVEDIISKMVSSFFRQNVLWQGEGAEFFLYLYEVEEPVQERLKRLTEKLAYIIQNVVGAGVSVMATQVMDGGENVRTARQQLLYLENCYFHQPEEFLIYDGIANLGRAWRNTDIPDKAGMIRAVMEKNAEEIKKWFETAGKQYSICFVDRTEAVRNCIALYHCICGVLSGMPNLSLSEGRLLKEEEWIPQISVVARHEDMIRWLEALCAELCSFVQSAECIQDSRDYVEMAQDYVQQNIFKRNSLSEVSSAINISPNYLSSLFKKNLSINFVDYVNQQKMKKACELLRQREYMLYEIANMLHYENAYYFTKIFRKYVGCSPKEYRLSLKK